MALINNALRISMPCPRGRAAATLHSLYKPVTPATATIDIFDIYIFYILVFITILCDCNIELILNLLLLNSYYYS